MSFWSDLSGRSGGSRLRAGRSAPNAGYRGPLSWAWSSDHPGLMAWVAQTEGRPLNTTEGMPAPGINQVVCCPENNHER